MAKKSTSASKKSGSKTSSEKPSAESSATETVATEAEATVSNAVTPSAMKKDLEAANQPTPEIAKEPDPETLERPEGAADEGNAGALEPALMEDTRPEIAALAASPAPVERSGGAMFWPLLLGGLVAGIIGFAVSELDLLNSRSVNDGLRSQLAEQEGRISTLEAAEPDLSALDDISDQLAGLTDQIAGQESRITELEDRLTAIEALPVGEGGGGISAAAIAAYERELATLQQTVEDMISNARSVEEATASAAREARVRAALADITAAVGTGQPFADAVAALTAADADAVPDALVTHADEGVVTLSNLQGRYSDAARAGLSAARAAGAVEGETGVGGFLRRQLGARSVAPREGDDPDAVLSRVGAAVQDGQLAQALAEVATLPEGAIAAMQGWITDAQARADVQAALQTLSQSLSTN